MAVGRPPQGAGQVGRLEGPAEVKRRLEAILKTLTGEMTIAEACEQLALSESRLHELRRQALEGALGALMPRPAGRPSAGAGPIPSEEQLLERVRDLEIDLQAALVRTELALAMPHLFAGAGKKNSSRRGGRRKRRGG